jgi:hypothetical protein
MSQTLTRVDRVLGQQQFLNITDLKIAFDQAIVAISYT